MYNEKKNLESFKLINLLVIFKPQKLHIFFFKLSFKQLTTVIKLASSNVISYPDPIFFTNEYFFWGSPGDTIFPERNKLLKFH